MQIQKISAAGILSHLVGRNYMFGEDMLKGFIC